MIKKIDSIFAIFLLSMTTLKSNSLEIIAHRGDSENAPENTLASVNLAWEKNTDAVEVDVHLSKDGKVVAIHDDNTERTGGKDSKVSEQTLAELKRLDVGSWKDKKWTGEKIPTLKEVIDTIPEGKRLFIEIKCGTEIIAELERIIKKSEKNPKQFVIIAFSYPTVIAVKEKFPHMKVLWLSSFKKDEDSGKWEPTADELVQKALQAKLDGLDLRACDAIDKEFVEKIREAKLEFFVWTVDSVSLAENMIKFEVDGITTNRPRWLRKSLNLF